MRSSIAGYMGDLVAWRFDNFRAPRAKVVDVFRANGFSAFFETDLSDPARALGQAFRSGIDYGRSFIAKPMPKKNKDTAIAIGVYERVAKQGEGGDEWPCGARVRIVNDQAVAMPPEGAIGREPCIELAKRIAARSNSLMSTVENNELSNAIVFAGAQCMWAPFRQAGGVYWVHERNAARLRRLFDEVESLGGFFATVQPLFGDDEGRTMRNLEGAASSAIAAELASLAVEIENAQLGKLGKRAVESRIADCHELMIRAELYGAALADKLDGIKKTITEFRAKFGQAIGTDFSASLDARDGALNFSEFESEVSQ